MKTPQKHQKPIGLERKEKMTHTYHSFEELPTPEEKRETTGGLPAGSGNPASQKPVHDVMEKALIKAYMTRLSYEDSLWKPKARMHIAFTCAEFLKEFELNRSNYNLHPGRFFEINGAFSEWYLKEMNSPDGSDNRVPAKQPDIFEHLWLKYNRWLDSELKKPAPERACEFDENGKPVMDDEFKALRLVAEEFCAPCLESERMYDDYDLLAFRRLVPDFSGVNRLDWATAYERGFHRNAFALKDDGKLLPPAFVDYVLERKRREGLTAELDGETALWMREFRMIDDEFPRNYDEEKEGSGERAPDYYQPSMHAYERLTPINALDPESARKALEGRSEDPEAQARYAIGMGAGTNYPFFSNFHHPTNPYHFAHWFVKMFDVEHGKMYYRGTEIERTAGLGLLSDEFIAYYIKMMDACCWSEENGSPIACPVTHVLNSFDWWRKGRGKALMGADGFPKDQGRYAECLYFAWQTWPWDVRTLKKRENNRPGAYDNLALRGIVPYFSEKSKEAVARTRPPKEKHDFTPPDDGRKKATSDEMRHYNIGFPLPYAGFSPEHHPTSPMHLALWLTSFSEWTDIWGDGIRHNGPYVKRAGELGKLHWSFVTEYLAKMDAQGWVQEDGSRIADALKHILDAFEEWRKRELSKPPKERSCSFGEDGFPSDQGKFSGFLHAAWKKHDFIFGNVGNIAYDDSFIHFEALAFRGLYPDFSHVRELPLEEIAFRPWLFRKLEGFEDDDRLFPQAIAKKLIRFRDYVGPAAYEDWSDEYNETAQRFLPQLLDSCETDEPPAGSPAGRHEVKDPNPGSVTTST